MAISVTYNAATFCINVPQSDLTLVSGVYEHDTTDFWEQLKAWEASETGIVFEDMQSHNPPYTVAGETYARKVEVLNATNSSNTDVYEVCYVPDTAYTVKLTGSNNNIFDKQNAILKNTNVQVLPTNSAGLIVYSTGSGLSTEQATMLEELWKLQGLQSGNPVTVTPSQRKTDDDSVDLALTGDGVTTTTITRQ